jgi:uncharacterized protein YjbJ (UPF0337 family)
MARQGRTKSQTDTTSLAEVRSDLIEFRGEVREFMSSNKAIAETISEKIDQVHGRIKSIEGVVSGDEEKGIIGLAEKLRSLEKDRTSSDKKRASLFVVVGWLAAFFGSYVLRQFLPEKATPISIETEASAQSVGSR